MFVQVIAFLCGALAIALLVMSLASTDWLMAQGWRQGLFLHCIDDGAEKPLPFGLDDKVGCYRVRDESEQRLFDYKYSIDLLYIFLLKRCRSDHLCYADYIRATAGLCILALATNIFATLLTGRTRLS